MRRNTSHPQSYKAQPRYCPGGWQVTTDKKTANPFNCLPLFLSPFERRRQTDHYVSHLVKFSGKLKPMRRSFSSDSCSLNFITTKSLKLWEGFTKVEIISKKYFLVVQRRRGCLLLVQVQASPRLQWHRLQITQWGDDCLQWHLIKFPLDLSYSFLETVTQ